MSFILFGVQVQMSIRKPQLILDLQFRSLKIAVSIQGSICSAGWISLLSIKFLCSEGEVPATLCLLRKFKTLDLLDVESVAKSLYLQNCMANQNFLKCNFVQSWKECSPVFGVLNFFVLLFWSSVAAEKWPQIKKKASPPTLKKKRQIIWFWFLCCNYRDLQEMGYFLWPAEVYLLLNRCELAGEGNACSSRWVSQQSAKMGKGLAKALQHLLSSGVVPVFLSDCLTLAVLS